MLTAMSSLFIFYVVLFISAESQYKDNLVLKNKKIAVHFRGIFFFQFY